MNNQRLVHFLLRLSIASVFLYAAVAATLQPDNWLFYFPQSLRDAVPGNILLPGFSLLQLLLAIWLLSGWKTFLAAILSSVTLIGIITANIQSLDVVFRDFAIFFAALALAVGSYKK